MAVTSIELQIISRLLTTELEEDINTLLAFDSSYYGVFNKQIEFIFEHQQKYGDVPDVFTFQSEFPDITLVKVTEPLKYLCEEMQKNKRQLIMIEMFNKLKDLGSGDINEAWQYVEQQCDRAAQLDSTRPMDIVRDSKERADKIVEFMKQPRIPTGFNEIDKLMYGGLSTVEELLVLVARTNSGKSWICTRMMESAQKAGFPVLYYSPEMQAPFIGTRFDTWRTHMENSQLFQGKYTDEYLQYLEQLSAEEASAFVLEDKDVSNNEVNVRALEHLVSRYKIKLLIIDGLSYMSDVRKSDVDHIKYKNLCNDLFRLSKQQSCAVVIAMQANRETKENKDDKGDPFPNLSNIEGSDHPARIATQVFAIRQIFDKHVLDIRMEKSRNANNQKPVLSYAWDINTGNMQYLPDGSGGGTDSSTPSPSSMISPSAIMSNITTNIRSDDDIIDDMDDDDVEF